ncbi:MAG TPA: DUF1801 domain-containing protein [Herpetosiphonaceae bacterium]
MQSTARDVSAYLAEVPEERRPALEQLRALCLEVLAGAEEGMSYGMPCYGRHGTPEVAFASQKGYISLYINQAVVDAHREQLAGLNVGKGCIRYPRPQRMDFAVIRSMLEATLTAS